MTASASSTAQLGPDEFRPPMPDLLPVYLLSIAVAFVISLLEGHRHRPSVRRLSILLGYMLVSETTGYLLKGRANNQFLFYLYTPVEFLFLSYLYADHYTIPFACRVARVLGWCFAGFCVPYGGWSWFDSRLTQAPTLLYVIEWTLMLGLVLYYFYDLYRNDYFIILTRQPVFWMSIGNFFFYSGTFFLMGLVAELKRLDYDRAEQLFILNTLLNILLYLFWSIGFLCLRRTSPS